MAAGNRSGFLRVRILHLIGESVDIGGVLTLIRNLQEALRDSGAQHVVWVHRDYVESRQPALTYVYSTQICADSPSYAKIAACAVVGFFKLRDILKRDQFDVIHAHSRGTFLVALGLAVFLRKPVLYTNHGYSRQLWMYRFASRRRHFYTTLLTPSMAKYYGIEVNPPKVRIISSCCANEFFDQALVVSGRWRQEQRPVRFIGIGNVVRWKNWRLLLEAIAALANPERAQVEFVHWGPIPPDADSQLYQRELNEFIESRRLQKQARFGGRTPSVVERLREADWFVMPSLNEPCSAALIEAMALGLPALVSASGGNPTIVSAGRTGLLFEPNSVDNLAAKLRQIIDPGFQAFDAQEIRDSVRSRSARAIAPAFLQTYAELAER